MHQAVAQDVATWIFIIVIASVLAFGSWLSYRSDKKKREEE